MTVSEEATPKRYIQRVQVEGLFGQFDHDLSFGEHTPEHPNLLILYGENGSGKTTLLWMLYHLLNKEGKRGHRTYLAHQQFRKLVVTFSDGLEISALRENADKGSFEVKIARAAADPASFKYVTGKEGEIPAADSDDPIHSQFTALLPELNFGFLPHDRSTRVSPVGRRSARARLRPQTAGGPVSPIRTVINGAIATARQQAIRASNQGQLTVNAIYTELVRQIAQVPLTPPEGVVDEGRFNLLNRLQQQARITQDYSKFGLTSELQVEGLLETLQTMPPSRFYIVDTVLKPFLQDNEARLQALNPLHIALTTAVEA
jgi:energy-coupling factor transporter ATP-binding protein EcfA2